MAFYTDGVVPWNSLDNNTRGPLASELESGYPCGEADQQLFNWTAGWPVGNIWNMILQSGITPDTDKLLDLARAVQSGKVNYAVAAGTANAITASLTPTPVSYSGGLQFRLRAIATSTSATPTINLNGLGPKTVVNPDGSPLTPGAIVANATQNFGYDATLDKILLLTPANTGVKQGAGWIRHSDGTYEAWGQVLFPGTTTQVDVTLPVTFPTSIDSVLVSDVGTGVYPGAGAVLSNSTIRCYAQPYIIVPTTGTIVQKNNPITLYYRVWGK